MEKSSEELSRLACDTGIYSQQASAPAVYQVQTIPTEGMAAHPPRLAVGARRVGILVFDLDTSHLVCAAG